MKFLLSTILLSLLFLNGCVAKGPTPEQDGSSSSAIKNIAILPVVSVVGKSDTVTYSQLKKQERGVEAFTQIIHDYFSDYNNITILSDEKVDSFDVSYTANPRAQALSIAKNIGAEAVMTVTMNRYTERDGGKYSVQQPASIAFEYLLMQTDSGQTICSGVFDETQKSLTDNILSFKTIFKRKLQWLTAEEFAREGITAKLNTCKYLIKPETTNAASN